MKWPLVLRSTYESVMAEMFKTIRSSREECDRLTLLVIESKDLLAKKEQEIASLTQLLAEEVAKKCKVYTSGDPQAPKISNLDPGTGNSRSGWRSRAASRSKQTVPVEKDSAKALEERVRQSGGTVHAV